MASLPQSLLCGRLCSHPIPSSGIPFPTCFFLYSRVNAHLNDHTQGRRDLSFGFNGFVWSHCPLSVATAQFVGLSCFTGFVAVWIRVESSRLLETASQDATQISSRPCCPSISCISGVSRLYPNSIQSLPLHPHIQPRFASIRLID